MPLVKKSPSGKIKRIEYRGRHLRVSRTGGVALRAQASTAGFNLSANSRHGIRLSRRIATGTQAGFQNGRFVLRGRYGRGPNKLNLSKTGVSVSSKTSIGSINWFKPRYTSAKIAGIHVRGKKAIYLHLANAVFQLLAFLAIFIAQILIITLQVILWLCSALAKSIWSMLCWIAALPRKHRAKQFAKLEESWHQSLTPLDQIIIRNCIEKVILELGKGVSLEAPTPSRIDQNRHQTEAILFQLLSQTSIPIIDRLELITSCLAEQFANKSSPKAVLDYLFEIDQILIANGGRNRLQERLINTFATTTGMQAN